MMPNVSMNSKRFPCLDDLARDNEYKRLDEGVVALLARLGPLERLECLDGLGSAASASCSGLEFSMDSNVMTMNTDVSTRQGGVAALLVRFDKGVAALLVRLERLDDGLGCLT